MFPGAGLNLSPLAPGPLLSATLRSNGAKLNAEIRITKQSVFQLILMRCSQVRSCTQIKLSLKTLCCAVLWEFGLLLSSAESAHLSKNRRADQSTFTILATEIHRISVIAVHSRGFGGGELIKLDSIGSTFHIFNKQIQPN